MRSAFYSCLAALAFFVTETHLSQNGARYIVLTSRSGRDSIVKRGFSLSRRLLTYLETIPDLTLRLAAVDALSSRDMKTLLESLERPLGGCMILSAVFLDRPFSSQTQETFNASFAPKTGAFETLEALVSLQALDFIVTFSSVSGLFGNAGQTNYAMYAEYRYGFFGRILANMHVVPTRPWQT